MGGGAIGQKGAPSKVRREKKEEATPKLLAALRNDTPAEAGDPKCLKRGGVFPILETEMANEIPGVNRRREESGPEQSGPVRTKTRRPGKADRATPGKENKKKSPPGTNTM